MNDARSIGWFGKLPCAGDFVHRRLPRVAIETIDGWCRQGLTLLRATNPADWQQMYRTAPIWNCAIPEAIVQGGITLVGLVAPSYDRVGRDFPLCAGVAIPTGQPVGPMLASAHEWLASLARAVRFALTRPSTIETFDEAVRAIPIPDLTASDHDDGGSDILAILDPGGDDVVTVPMPIAHALPWPELPLRFDPNGPTSYWWTNTSGGAGLRGFTTDGGLAPTLMLTLMRAHPGIPRGHA